MTLALVAVRQEFNNSESSVVVKELEFAMNLAVNDISLSFEYQYIVGSLGKCQNVEAFTLKYLKTNKTGSMPRHASLSFSKN